MRLDKERRNVKRNDGQRILQRTPPQTVRGDQNLVDLIDRRLEFGGCDPTLELQRVRRVEPRRNKRGVWKRGKHLDVLGEFAATVVPFDAYDLAGEVDTYLSEGFGTESGSCRWGADVVG